MLLSAIHYSQSTSFSVIFPSGDLAPLWRPLKYSRYLLYMSWLSIQWLKDLLWGALYALLHYFQFIWCWFLTLLPYVLICCIASAYILLLWWFYIILTCAPLGIPELVRIHGVDGMMCPVGGWARAWASHQPKVVACSPDLLLKWILPPYLPTHTLY